MTVLNVAVAAVAAAAVVVVVFQNNHLQVYYRFSHIFHRIMRELKSLIVHHH